MRGAAASIDKGCGSGLTLIRHCFAMTPSPVEGEGALTIGGLVHSHTCRVIAAECRAAQRRMIFGMSAVADIPTSTFEVANRRLRSENSNHSIAMIS
jgi:hypothetical protein